MKTNNYKQFIADVYHCSGTWGESITENEMRTNLTEWNKAKAKGEYCPSVSLFKKCAAYWNKLCVLYPN